MKRTAGIIAVIAVVLLVGTLVFINQKFAVQPGGNGAAGTPDGGIIKVVAAENFYGNIAAQLGGDKVSVRNIISNPDVDPHEYESSVQDGIAIADANIVLDNGLQYDTWMDKLIAASPSVDRAVITAGDIAPDVLSNNPHVWYGVNNMMAVARAITDALVKADPADAALFQNNLSIFNDSLAPIIAKMGGIKAAYAGTPVGLTETIYLYQTGPMGLNVLTPLSFERAIAEGNDPSAQDVNIANQQIANKQVKVFIYNSQTVTPITTNLQDAAVANGIPVVPVTETMPAGDTYQSWMMDELNALETALAGHH